MLGERQANVKQVLGLLGVCLAWRVLGAAWRLLGVCLASAWCAQRLGGAELSPKPAADADGVPGRARELLEVGGSGLLAGGALAFLGELLFGLASSGELLFDLGDTLALEGELSLEVGGGGFQAGRFDLGECELAGELLEPAGLLADDEGEGGGHLLFAGVRLVRGGGLGLRWRLTDVDPSSNRGADHGA